MDLKTKTTAELLKLLGSRSKREYAYQSHHRLHGFEYSDLQDDSFVEDISAVLARRIDGLEKGPPEPRKPWEE